jgi:hypothetical protein
MSWKAVFENPVTSRYGKRGDSAQRRAALLRGALADVKRLEAAKRQGWDVDKELAQARRYVEAFRDNPKSGTWKRVPQTIGSLDHSTGKFYPNAPVLKVEAFPPGTHPPSAIRKDVTLVLIHTPYGVRQYGFADAYIDSSLRMRVKLSPGQERDEVVARWPSARGGRAG